MSPIGGGMETSMDIRETLLELINSETIRYSYMAIEKLIIVMMKDYLGSQNKRLFAENEVVHGISDMILPDGIDSDESCIAAEIKMYRHKQMSLRVIYDTIGRFSINRGDINKLLLIVVNELPDGIRKRIEEKKKQLNFELIIWDIDDLVQIFSNNESLFVETYNNLNTVLLRDTINNGILRNNSIYLEKRKKYVEQLHTQYENDNIVLFLGAGASNEAKIATWDTLISELFVALIDKQLSANHIQIDKKDKKKIVKEVINQNGNSPLLQTRFLRNGFENDFEELVREILYKNAVDSSDLLEEIGQLCIPNPNMRRLLEIAAQKRTENDGECQHYAIMRRFKIKDSEEVESIKSFERVNESLQESFFKELGVNVLWIDEFSEIPILLKQIKGNYDSY